MSNSVANNQEWIIIDINHSNTNGTVDLISKSSIIKYDVDTSTLPGADKNYGLLTSPNKTNSYYDNYTYTIRYFLDNYVIPGFSADAQNGLEPINISCICKKSDYYYWTDGMTNEYTAKIKVPSAYELGYRPSDGNTYNKLLDSTESGILFTMGDVYPYFPCFQQSPSSSSAIMDIINRSCYASGDYRTYYMSSEVSLSTGSLISFKAISGTCLIDSVRHNNWIDDMKKRAGSYYNYGYDNKVYFIFGGIIRFGKR